MLQVGILRTSVIYIYRNSFLAVFNIYYTLAKQSPYEFKLITGRSMTQLIMNVSGFTTFF